MASRIAGPIPTHEIYELPLVGSRTPLAQSRFGGSLGNLNVPRWQANFLPTNRHGMDSACGKNHIRENIRRIRKYQKASLLRKSSLGNIFVPKVKTVHELGSYGLPSRPSTAVPRPHRFSKENQMPTQLDKKSEIAAEKKDNAVGDRNMTQCDTDADHHLRSNTGTECSLLSEYIHGLPTPASVLNLSKQPSPCLAHCRATQYPTPERIIRVSQGVQVGNGDRMIGTQDFAQMTSQSLEPNRTNIRQRLRSTSADGRKHEFLRAHANTAADDCNLQVLGSMPVRQLNLTPRPEQLTVPKASLAKKVQLIRRDINFVRANAHLAAIGGKTSAKGQRCSSSGGGMRSSNPALAEVGLISWPHHQSRQPSNAGEPKASMWPQRRLPVGGIPSYLTKMRQREFEATEAAGQPDPDQPPGHQRMPEEERRNMLNVLQKAHKELTDEWSRLPLRMDTVRIRTRRAEIEQRLTELEQAISIFEKPKVYIRPE